MKVFTNYLALLLITCPLYGQLDITIIEPIDLFDDIEFPYFQIELPNFQEEDLKDHDYWKLYLILPLLR